MSDFSRIRKQFPALNQRINGQPLSYLDSAATTQKPATMIAAVQRYYRQENANVHRGSYQLAANATAQFEHTREQLAQWVGGVDPASLIWTRGTTEALNMIAHCWLAQQLSPGDEILVDASAHHANLIPWQQVARQTGAVLRIIPLDNDGNWDWAAWHELLSPQVKWVAVNHVSNVLGTVQPIAEIIQQAHQVGAQVVVDGAQAMAHFKVDLQALDADFYVFSAHKMYGPTGLGALYGKRCYLEQFEPWLTGGEMVSEVTEQSAQWAELPYRLEAGTPNMAAVAGFAATLDFLQQQDWSAWMAHEQALLHYAVAQLQTVPELQLIGRPQQQVAVQSFVMRNAHASDIAQWLDQAGIAVRTGQHCAMPLLQRLGLSGTLRLSLGCYNNEHDIDRLVAQLKKSVFASMAPVSATTTTPWPSAEAMRAQLQSVANNREQQFTLLMDYAARWPTAGALLRQPQHEVKGCESRAWLMLTTTPSGEWQFVADSDARLIRGVLAVIVTLAQARSLPQVATADWHTELQELGLMRYLSSSRGNGIRAVLAKLQKLAQQQ